MYRHLRVCLLPEGGVHILVLPLYFSTVLGPCGRGGEAILVEIIKIKKGIGTKPQACPSSF